MILSDLAELRFDISDYEDNKEKKAFLSKIASREMVTNTESLGDEDFALVITEKSAKLRKFPLCNVKTATISKLFLDVSKENLPDTLVKIANTNINAFLTGRPLLNNTISTRELYTAERELEKQAAMVVREKLADSDYAIVTTKDGNKIRLYPINDEINCKVASKYFSENYKKMPVEMRHKFASALVVKCASAGFNKNIISDDIRSYCNNKVNDNLDIEIAVRKDHVGTEKTAEALDVLRDLAISGGAPLTKVASYLAKLDEETGLNKLYDKSISDAYRAVFSKHSSSMDKTAAINPNGVGLVGEYEAASQVPYNEQMQGMFSEDDFNAALADPAAFEALPDPYKQAILQQAQQGV